jgi:subtilase family serine protease
MSPLLKGKNMKTKMLIIVVVAIAGMVLIPPSATAQQILHGHVPEAIARLHLKPTGRLAATNELRLAIGLAPRDEHDLDTFIQQLYDPISPNYRHYLTPTQFTERFGPTEQDYKTLIDFIKANGLNVTRQYSNRVVLDVNGSVADIETVFHVTMRTYQHPNEARTFYAPDVEPSLTSQVSVLHIEGLDNYTLPHPKHKQHSLTQNENATNSKSAKEGSAPGGNLWGNDFRNAYVPGTTLTGTGQSLGLLEFEGFYVNDITNYENDIGMSTTNRPQLVIVLVDGGTTQPQDGGGNGEECSGDIEMAVSMAPGLNAIYVFENGLSITNPHFDDIFESMVAFPNILQFSCSWGGGTASNATSEVLFKQMASQGQSFFDASGDTGAMVGNIEFPSDSPSITQVGGTTMTDGSMPAYPWKNEVVWNWGTNSSGNFNGNGHGASSGGISTYYTIPSWQTNISMMANQGSTIMRNFPDVAANADNDYLYTDNGMKSGGWGGTSYAAPLWAGFTALINQQAAANGKPPVGFLNPALYALASGINYTNYFHDITKGNNIWKSSPNLFYATNGYDLCTGLGTMKGTNLINALTMPLTVSLLILHAAEANFQFQFLTQFGFTHAVQYRTNLFSGSWQSYTNVTGDGTLKTISIPLSVFGPSAQGFVRVLTQ